MKSKQSFMTFAEKTARFHQSLLFFLTDNITCGRAKELKKLHHIKTRRKLVSHSTYDIKYV